MNTDEPPWSAEFCAAEPPERVAAVRQVNEGGYLLVRGYGPCADCVGGSVWQWERPDGSVSPWVCWQDIDAVGPLVEVRP